MVMKKSKVIGIIPARYNSTRFPGKLLKKWKGKTILQHVYDNVKQSKKLDSLIIATDSDRIYRAVRQFGGKVCITDKHETGTSRIIEVAKSLEADIVINIQGDEPLIKAETIDRLIEAMIEDDADLGTVITYINCVDMWVNNIVKAFVKGNYAVDFSRSGFPFRPYPVETYKHIGIYAYKKDVLMKYYDLPVGQREQKEKLEQLRAIENGYKFRVIKIDYPTIAVDTPEDLEKIKQCM